MERGWFVKSSFSRSEGGTAPALVRSYQISPIVVTPSPALLHGRGSTTPHGFGKARAWACSTVMSYVIIRPREHFSDTFSGSGENAGRKRECILRSDPFMFFGGVLDAVARVAGIFV